MDSRDGAWWSRREFVGGLTLAGTAGLLGLRPGPAAAEPPPETTTVRLARIRSICRAPQYVTEELLRGEGFSDVQYVVREGTAGPARALASGEIDMSMQYIGPSIIQLDRGDPIVLLGGFRSGASSCSGQIGCAPSAT